MNSAAPPATPRFPVYRPIHKALRAFMSDTLVAIGRMDPDDDNDVETALEQARSLLAMLRVHLEDENRFVHPAMEARRPGSTDKTAHDHVEHECALADLDELITRVSGSQLQERTSAASTLYRRLALFVAENFEHMHIEEHDNAAVLWAEYSDEELMAIEAAIVASVPPAAMAVAARWMMSGLNHSERVATLLGIRQTAPTEAFEGLLAIARSHLNARDWAKLADALSLPPARAA